VVECCSGTLRERLNRHSVEAFATSEHRYLQTRAVPAWHRGSRLRNRLNDEVDLDRTPTGVGPQAHVDLVRFAKLRQDLAAPPEKRTDFFGFRNS
jgi:hypothetical protein